MNRAGIGRPSKPSDSEYARDIIDPPTNLEVTSVGRDYATLKPEYDGGAKITGYVVERKDSEKDSAWLRCNFSNVSECFYTVSGLIESHEYLFRVYVKNAANSVSANCEVRDFVTCEDSSVPPNVDMDAKFAAEQIIRAGDDLYIEGIIHGSPAPVIEWMFNKERITSNQRITIVTDDLKTSTKILGANKFDTGTFSVKCQNFVAQRIVDVKVRVLDAPGPCNKVSVSNVYADRALVSWEKPDHDGNQNVTSYTLEKRETSHLSWVMVASGIDCLSYKATHLLEGNEYVFRVRAENKSGLGDACESEEIVAVNPFVKPEKPGRPEIRAVTKQSVSLGWARPANDGGAPISGFWIEKKQRQSLRWVKATKKPSNDLCDKAANLTEGQQYEFRIVAINAAGMSEPGDACAPVLIEDPRYAPEAPKKLKCIDSTESSITLKWSEPIFDGGALVEGYIVEYLICKEEDPVWVKCSRSSLVTETTFTVKGLEANGMYKMRVAAVNRIGTGELKEGEEAFQALERSEKPEI